MGKEYQPDDLVTRIFLMSMVAIGAFIAVVFMFIL